MLSTERRAGGRRLGGASLGSLGGVEWGKNFDIGRKCWLADNEMQGRAVHSFPLTEGAGDSAVANDRIGPRLCRRVGPHGAPRRLQHAAVGLPVAPSTSQGGSVDRQDECREDEESSWEGTALPRTIAIVFIAMHFCTADISLIILLLLSSVVLDNDNVQFHILHQMKRGFK